MKKNIISLLITLLFSISICESKPISDKDNSSGFKPLGTGLCNSGVNYLSGDALTQCEDWLKRIDLKLKNNISKDLRHKLEHAEISCRFHLDATGKPKNLHIIGDSAKDESKALRDLVERSSPYPVAPLKLWNDTAITIQISTKPEIQFVRLAKIPADFLKSSEK